jgi:two-component system LytT family response regulator
MSLPISMRTETPDVQRIRAVVVDDEPAAREYLAELVAARRDIELCGSFGDPAEALDALLHDTPDLLFLDVQMPKLNGFELLDALGDRTPPAVIFTTAYDQHAIDAFDVSATDYLLKPFDDARLDRALARAAIQIESAAARASDERENVDGTDPLTRALHDQEMYARTIPIRVRDRIILQRVDEVTWFEADGKYIRVHVGTSSALIRCTMQRLEQRVDPRRFMRVSRFAIVNIEQIKHIEPWSHGDYVLTLRSGGTVVTTQSYRDALRRLVQGP